jgi:hypothetical protein
MRQSDRELIGDLSCLLLKQKVGFVRVTKPQSQTRHYEVAAWYTKLETDTGDFDIFLGNDHIYPKNLHVYAELPATVTSNNHAPLFAGNPIGAGEDRRGQRENTSLKAPWAEAAAGRANRDGVEWYIDRNHLDAAIQYAENHLRDYGSRFDEYWKTYLEQPRDKFNSNISMVSHFGENVSKWGRLLENLLREKENRFGSFAQYEKVQGRPEIGHGND